VNFTFVFETLNSIMSPLFCDVCELDTYCLKTIVGIYTELMYLAMI